MSEPAKAASPFQDPCPDITRRTYRLELARSPFIGLIEAGWLTFGLTIATKVYDAPDYGKALIAAAFAIGLLVTPLTLYLLSFTRLKIATLCALILASASAFLVVSAIADTFWPFAFGLIFSQIFASQQSTFLIRIHSENYPSRTRGTRLSLVFSIASLSGALAAFFGGSYLDNNIEEYKGVILVMCAALLISALITYRIPSRELGADAHDSPFRNLSLAWTDKLFGKLLFAWMLMGIGNLMIIPLRIEYLANPLYGINATVLEIATITFIIPAIVRILSTGFWGYLFDRTNFIVLRTVLNTCFFISITLFFFTDNKTIMAVSAVFMGLGMGGGNIAWNLWVTKVAPPDKISAYMSVHTGLTGIRGIAAPFMGFALIAAFGPSGVGVISGILIFLSIVMFIGNTHEERLRKV
jgi:MFS family permease